MGADGELKRQAEQDTTEAFLWASQNAVARYADWRFAALARHIRDMLEREAPSGVFELPSHANQWREFCYHAHFGPPELDPAFDHLVDPKIDHSLEKLPEEEAVLLSIAQQWATEALENPDGRTVSPDLLRRGAKLALLQLASAADCDSWDG